MAINQNQALFALLGTTYGGNGVTTFQLPNLQGRVPMHMGTSSTGNHTLGEVGGEATHVLQSNEAPLHTHALIASQSGTQSVVPTGNVLGGVPIYAPPGTITTLNPASISSVGGAAAHENTQPYLALDFCIALQGIFPSQN